MRRESISWRRKSLVLGAGLALAATVAGPAGADPVCAGTVNTVHVCVDAPTGAPLIDDCVYTGGRDCTQVTVPGPTRDCSDPLIERTCDPL